MDLEYGTELKTFSIKSSEKNQVDLNLDNKLNLIKPDTLANSSEPKAPKLPSEAGENIKTEIEETKTSIEKSGKSPDPTVKPEEVKKNTIKCCKCGVLLAFPEGSYFVSCPQCTTVTATVELLTLSCQFCRLMSYFPKSALSVQCRCGAIYKVK